MATKIVTKNSSTASAVPTASDLVQGELAVNVADKRLFTEDNAGAIVELGTNPSTIDINAGTIDGTAIGASSASTGAFTTLTATGINVAGTVVADSVEVDGLLHIDGSDNSNVASFALTRADASWSIDNETNFRIYGNTGDTTNPATKRFEISTGGDISFYEDTGTTPKLFWDASAESLGIGTSSPTEKLHIVGGDLGIGSTQYRENNIVSYASADYSIATSGAYNLTFKTNNAERLRIDSAGNVGIGTSSPVTALEISTDGTDQLTLNRADASISINNVLGGIVVSADDPTANRSGAKIGFTAGANWTTNNFPTNIIFSNDASGTMTERMRIDSSGNLLVGTTDTTPGIGDTNAGISMSAANGIIISRANDAPINISRNSSDGALTYFRKDGAIVGSIGYGGGGILYNAASNYGLKFYDAGGANIIHPATTAGGDKDSSIDLGYSGARFKDLYLSGGVYLGGTGSANKLDDYEEGTFTPSFQNGSFTYSSVTSGVYVKVGDLVVVNMNIGWSAKSGSGNLAIVGLPFTAFNLSSMRFTGSLGYTFGLDFGGRELPTVTGSGNTAVMNFFANADNATPVSINVSDCSSSGELQITASYRAI